MAGGGRPGPARKTEMIWTWVWIDADGRVMPGPGLPERAMGAHLCGVVMIRRNVSTLSSASLSATLLNFSWKDETYT